MVDDNIEKLLNTDVDAIDNSIKAKRKRIAIVIVIAILCLLCFICIKLLPSRIKYYKASQAEAKGDYRTAYDLYITLNEEFDTRDKIKEVSIKEANRLLEAGEIKDAYDFYLSIPEAYKDEGECTNLLYHLALNNYKSKEYTVAYNRFTQLGDYLDSDEMARESQYQYVIQDEKKSNSYTYVYLQELAASNYKDSVELLKEYNKKYPWEAIFLGANTKSELGNYAQSFKRYEKVYFHFQIKGGPPNTGTNLFYNVIWPNGDEETNSLTNEYRSGKYGNGDSITIWCSSGTSGTCVINIIADNTVIGSGSVRLY